MQTSQRKIPVPGGVKGVGTNYLWSQLVPLYQQELADFQKRVARLKESVNTADSADEADDQAVAGGAVQIAFPRMRKLTRLKLARNVFTDANFTIQSLAPELNGLTGIRFSHEAAKAGRYQPMEFEAAEPVQVLVGYFKTNQNGWLQVPKLETAAQADERGGMDTVIENAAAISELPGLWMFTPFVLTPAGKNWN